MKKIAQGFNTEAQDSNFLSRESEALCLSHCALHTDNITLILFNDEISISVFYLS